MINEAYISGQIHKAIFKKDGSYYIFETGPDKLFKAELIRLIDFNSFLLSHPEIEQYKDINWTEEQLKIILDKEISKHEALELFLNGMDTTYSEGIRGEAIEILLHDYFADDDIKIFVKNRTFGTKRPEQFDPTSASQIAQGFNNTELVTLYNDLSYSSNIIIAVRSAWEKAIIEHLGSINEVNIPLLDRQFTDNGIFADFVFSILKRNSKALKNIIFTHSDHVKQLGISQSALFLETIKKNILNQYYILAESLKTNRKLEEVLELFDNIIVTFGNNKGTIEARNGKANVLAEMGQLQQALDLYYETTTNFVKDMTAYCGISDTLRKMGRYKEALEIYHETIATFGDDIVAYRGIAEILMEIGQYKSVRSYQPKENYNEIRSRTPAIKQSCVLYF